MTDRPLDWPALRGDALLPPSLEYERGVRGKVHGAPTDFRWIARSSAFGLGCADLDGQLNLGSEDAPCSFQAWRSTGDRCFAVTGYPSRAIDAAGRSGFLEKQVLDWRKTPAVPAALAALLLLPAVAEMTDDVWWDHAPALGGSGSVLVLALDSSQHAPVTVDEERIAEMIERGRKALRETLEARALGSLYDQLLSTRRPACLPGIQKPLSPEALAVLLLPLPRDVADRISLAGWIPSSRVAVAELGRRWDALVTDDGMRAAAPSDVAAQMAESLLRPETRRPVQRPAEATPRLPVANNTSSSNVPAAVIARPGVRLDLPPPDAGAAPVVQQLYDFACAVDCRWLSPLALKKAGGRMEFRFADPEMQLLRGWIAKAQKSKPPYASEKQWLAKIDLLRSAAIVLAPEPSTVNAVGIPTAQSPVPALLFGLMLDSRRQMDPLAGIDPDLLRRLLEQSTSCPGSPYWNRHLSKWLDQWQKSPTAETSRSGP